MDRTQTQRRTLTAPAPHLMLRVCAGPDLSTYAILAQGTSVAVGTAEHNELRLSDPLVSRYHLELKYTRDCVELRDLESRNGTFLSAERVRVFGAQLPLGCRVGLGETQLILEVGGEAGQDAESAPDETIPGLVAQSDAMRRIARVVRQLADASITVLIRGETGSGKEVIAQLLHSLSPRRSEPFAVVDCGSMPATLIASELFGHERGAFTGADRKHEGAFERAQKGTLFLDEIGELPLQVQPALLGALERRRFRRVGGSKDLAADVRIVAATHRDLRAEVNQGRFRSDLYYRLAAARIVVPPLRERREDIEALVRHFVQQISGTSDPLPFSPDVMEALIAHRWSGNARELRNVVECAMAMGTVELERTGSLATNRDSIAAPPASDCYAGLPYKQARAAALQRFEHGYLVGLMRKCDNNASEVARRAQMDRGYLLTLLRRRGLR